MKRITFASSKTKALPFRPIAAGASIGHIHLKVADLDRALAFYRDVLGFEVTDRFGRNAVFLATGGYHHHIGLNTWESAGGRPPAPGTTGLYHAAILYPTRADLADALRRLLAHGIRIDGAADHGVSEAIYLRDPDGNGFELYWDRSREDWPRHGDGSIALWPESLDLDSLSSPRTERRVVLGVPASGWSFPDARPDAPDLRWLATRADRDGVNLDLLRSFFAISEFGSMSRAAEQLRVSQSTLTRQMQTLEAEIGGHLLERGPTGVALTAAGHALLEGMRPVVARADIVVSETRKLALGLSASVRIGYIMSAAGEYLNPAIAALRRSHPETKVHLVDLSPGEQVAALRRGELDVVVLGNINAAIAREFFVRRIAKFPVVVALPETHALATHDAIALADLRKEMFVGAHADDIPGFNHWIVQLCRPAGFRPRIVENAKSLTQALSLLVAENAVTLLPALVEGLKVPGVGFRPLRDAAAKWELQVAWHRGKITQAVRELVRLLTKARS